MASGDGQELADQLWHCGCEVAVVSWPDPCVPEWLGVGDCQGRAAAWLRGREPGDPVVLESLMLRGLRQLLACPGWLEGAIRACGATIAEGGTPEIDPDNRVVRCLRGQALADLEIVSDSGGLGLPLLTRRRQVAVDYALIRDLRESPIRHGAPTD